MADNTDDDSPKALIQRIIEAMNSIRSDAEYFDKHMMTNLTLLSATVNPTDPTLAQLTFSLHVVKEICNGMGTLHGGAVATIFDFTTSTSIWAVAKPGFWDTNHVSRTLNVAYLRPAPAGTDVLIECDIVHLGKNMAMLKGVMRRKDDGKVLYTCEHNKARVPSVGMKL